MKTLGILLTTITIVFLSLYIGNAILGHYKLERDIMSYWNLADKASTIEKKSEYIDKFVESLNKQNYQGQYNAIFLTTPDNSFDANYDALKSFQNRLQEIKLMDIKSFEYQTALQQITEQEQGDALNMLYVFKGIWWKINYFLLWNWVSVVGIIINIIGLILGIIIWLNEL